MRILKGGWGPLKWYVLNRHAISMVGAHQKQGVSDLCPPTPYGSAPKIKVIKSKEQTHAPRKQPLLFWHQRVYLFQLSGLLYD